MSTRETATADVRQELLAAMRDAADEIIDGAFKRLLGLPIYDSLRARDEADVREFTSWLFHVFLRCLAEDRTLSPAETARLAAVGRRRSDVGIDVDGFTAAFEIVYDRSHARLAHLVTEASDPAATAVFGQLSRALGSLSRAAVLAVASGVDDGHEPPADARTRAATVLMQALTTGRADDGLLVESTRVLGVAPDDPLDIVIAVPRDEQPTDPGVLRGLGSNRGLEPLAGTVRERPVRHAVWLVHAPSDGRRLDDTRAAPEPGHILITQRMQGVGDLGTQYTDVRPHLHLAHHLADGGVVSLDDLRMFAEFGSADLSIVEPFVRSRLGDVLAQEPDQAETTLATIEAYLESARSHKLTGERLHLHPKTVAARIRKVRQRTTVPLGGGVDGMLTLLAVKVLRARGSDLPDIGEKRWRG